MSYGGSGDAGSGWRNDGGVRPTAFDPWTQPELFRGVLTRRFFAFLIDLVVLSVPVILACLFIAVFGVVTLGARLGAVLAGFAGIGGLGAGLLRRFTWRAAFGYRRHAHDGSRDADLVRRPQLFCTRGDACGGVLDVGLVSHPVYPAGRAVQRPAPPAARHRPGNHNY